MAWHAWQISHERVNEAIPPGLVLKNITYTKSSHGRAIWTFSAQQAEHNRQSGLIKAKKIHLVFHDKIRGDIELTADMGQIHSGNETIRVMGHVRIEDQPDNILTTDWMEYDERSGILKTTAPVHIRLDGSTIEGKGLSIDTKQRKLFVSSDVNATLDNEQDGNKDHEG